MFLFNYFSIKRTPPVITKPAYYKVDLPNEDERLLDGES